MDLAHLLQLYSGSYRNDSRLIIYDYYGHEIYDNTADINKRGFIMDKIFNDEMSYYIWSCDVDCFDCSDNEITIWLRYNKRLYNYLYQ